MTVTLARRVAPVPGMHRASKAQTRAITRSLGMPVRWHFYGLHVVKIWMANSNPRYIELVRTRANGMLFLRKARNGRWRYLHPITGSGDPGCTRAAGSKPKVAPPSRLWGRVSRVHSRDHE